MGIAKAVNGQMPRPQPPNGKGGVQSQVGGQIPSQGLVAGGPPSGDTDPAQAMARYRANQMRGQMGGGQMPVHYAPRSGAKGGGQGVPPRPMVRNMAENQASPRKGGKGGSVGAPQKPIAPPNLPPRIMY